ncbi:hypothetical protein OIU79_001742 [Salix purpurea]|uniref:Uncharacterized protein n=1 Tax=Salix purpurea TaxID=77065 RepID=A0A9Q0URF9_SALPP|nr:hypothetical protein OIU79_001742 [Salix purpurea]
MEVSGLDWIRWGRAGFVCIIIWVRSGHVGSFGFAGSITPFILFSEVV